MPRSPSHTLGKKFRVRIVTAQIGAIKIAKKDSGQCGDQLIGSYWMVWVVPLPSQTVSIPPGTHVRGSTVPLGPEIIIPVKGTEGLVQVVAQAVPCGSSVCAQLDDRVVTEHVPQSKPIVVRVGRLSLEILQVDVELLRFRRGDEFDLLETQEKVSLQVTKAILVGCPIPEEVLLVTDSPLDDHPAPSGDFGLAIHLQDVLAHLNLLDAALLGVQSLAGGIVVLVGFVPNRFAIGDENVEQRQHK